VIQADLWKLAQARPGAHLHFVPCSAEDARAALARQVREGQRLRHALRTLTE
jgi:allophanate hydrolase subunit 2